MFVVKIKYCPSVLIADRKLPVKNVNVMKSQTYFISMEWMLNSTLPIKWFLWNLWLYEYKKVRSKLSIRKLRLTHYNRKLVCVFSDTNNFYKSCDPHHFLRLRALLDRSFFIKKSVHFSLATNYYLQLLASISTVICTPNSMTFRAFIASSLP